MKKIIAILSLLFASNVFADPIGIMVNNQTPDLIEMKGDAYWLVRTFDPHSSEMIRFDDVQRPCSGQPADNCRILVRCGCKIGYIYIDTNTMTLLKTEQITTFITLEKAGNYLTMKEAQ